jgi:pyruvate dehydrogenase E1 component alpha subunit
MTDGDAGPAPDLDKSQAIDFYRRMLLVRRFEETAGRLYVQGVIKGFLHLYTGQEAVAVGSISALRDTDYVVSHFRDHGHALARGMDPALAMAELCGKATGTSGGRGGSMHLFDADRRFMGGYAIVGAQMPVAVGLALAIRYRNDGDVVLCFLGDGAVNQGEFHESMNLAALWDLPVLFMLENNLYGMGSRIDQTRAGGGDLYLAAEPYNMPAAQIDGMDVGAVHAATAEALGRVRSGAGPAFIEALTYRFRGHSVSDPSVYRDAGEVDQWRPKDPIEQLKTRWLENGLVSSDEIEEVDEAVDQTVRDAVRFAEESPEPDVESLSDHVYA